MARACATASPAGLNPEDHKDYEAAAGLIEIGVMRGSRLRGWPFRVGSCGFVVPILTAFRPQDPVQTPRSRQAALPTEAVARRSSLPQPTRAPRTALSMDFITT